MPDDNDPKTRIRNTFQLGWSLAELRGRILTSNVSRKATSATAPETTRLSDMLWRGSQWRISFDRVSQLHQGTGFGDDLMDSRYDPGARVPEYAYADYAVSGVIPAVRTKPDAAADGAQPQPDPAPAGAESQPDTFRLREATRRTINCLDLLYLDPTLMLRPATVDAAQRDLVAAVSRAPQGTAAGNQQQLPPPVTQLQPPAPPVTEQQPPAQVTEQQPPAQGTQQPPPGGEITTLTRNELSPAIDRVTRDAVQLIETWSGYLRERFADAAKDAQSAQLLIAFQAGQAMGELCWNLTDEALPCEANPEDPKLKAVWQRRLAARDISYLQHMLAVLAADGSTGSLDPKVIRSVSRSLDVWERTVRWLCDGNATGPLKEKPFDRDLRAALIEQASIWQALVQGERDLTAFTQPGVTQRLYVESAKILAGSVRPQQLASLEHAVVDQAHAVLDPLITDVSTTITQITTGLTRPLVATWRQVLIGLWPVVLVALIALLGLGGLAIVLATNGNTPASITSFLGAAVVGALGFLHLNNSNQQRQAGAQTIIDQVETKATDAQKTIAPLVEQKATELQAKVNEVGQEAQKTVGGIDKAIGDTPAQLVHTAVDAVKETVQKAVTQVLADLDELEGVLAISYPLIDYIASKTPAKPAAGTDTPKSPAYDFLTTVVWNTDDEHQELLQVANAAFGPAGVFAVAATFESPPPNPAAQQNASPRAGP
jgi:hypothetical protein